MAGGGKEEEEEENLSKTLEESHHDDQMPTAAASSDDSESEDEDDAEVDQLRIDALEQALRNQPLDYDSHLQYINCLRKSGEIKKLRNAREEMNRLFPLSPNLWQDWIGDEISLNQGAEAFSEIEKLYERAVQEYLSVPLWCDYINFVQERDESVLQCSPEGAAKMRALLERAITVAGFHVNGGSKIWEAYREYEQALLLTIDEESNEDKAKQNQRIRSLFHRQLAVPLENIKETLMNYKGWEADQGNSNDMDNELDGVPPNVALNYQKASAAYNVRKQYEDQLTSPVQNEADKLQNYMNYIKFEESSSDPTRVQILYERAISELPVSSDLWLGYTSYLDRTLKVASILKNVYYRATRNCPWISELWVRYMLSLERMNSSEEEIKSVFEQSLQCAFQTAKEYLDIYLTRIDGLRRRFSLDQEDFDFQLIRQTFMDASDSLSAQISLEELLSLHKYWAKLELSLGKDLTAARGVWDNLIKKSGSTLESYEGYIAMEVEMGNLHEARTIYKRCYAKRFAGTGSEDICHAWVKFEREHGTLDDYDIAVKKVTARLNEVMLFKLQQESKGKINQSAASVKENTTSPLKRKTEQKTSAKTQPPAKKRRQNAPEVEETKPDSGQIEVESEQQPEKEEGKGQEVERPKAEFYNDQCTAFVSNLNLRTNEEDVKSFFSDCGGATAVRLVRDKVTGKSRGFAYVDFSDDQHLQAAIAKNKKQFHGMKLSIARSDPSRSKKSRSSTAGSSRGRGTGRRLPPRSESKSSEEERSPSKDERSIDAGPRGKEKYKVTSMAPRSVMKPLGWNKKDGKGKDETSGGDELKSNEEFRNLFLKK